MTDRKYKNRLTSKALVPALVAYDLGAHGPGTALKTSFIANAMGLSSREVRMAKDAGYLISDDPDYVRSFFEITNVGSRKARTEFSGFRREAISLVNTNRLVMSRMKKKYPSICSWTDDVSKVDPDGLNQLIRKYIIPKRTAFVQAELNDIHLVKEVFLSKRWYITPEFRKDEAEIRKRVAELKEKEPELWMKIAYLPQILRILIKLRVESTRDVLEDMGNKLVEALLRENQDPNATISKITQRLNKMLDEKKLGSAKISMNNVEVQDIFSE